MYVMCVRSWWMKIEKSEKERCLLLVLSVNKRSGGLSIAGRGFCGARSRVFPERRVSDSARSLQGKNRAGVRNLVVGVGRVPNRASVRLEAKKRAAW